MIDKRRILSVAKQKAQERCFVAALFCACRGFWELGLPAVQSWQLKWRICISKKDNHFMEKQRRNFLFIFIQNCLCQMEKQPNTDVWTLFMLVLPLFVLPDLWNVSLRGPLGTMWTIFQCATHFVSCSANKKHTEGWSSHWISFTWGNQRVGGLKVSLTADRKFIYWLAAKWTSALFHLHWQYR